MAPDFGSYRRESNLFGELGPVCPGKMVKTPIPHGPKVPNDWVCSEPWTGTKVKFGTPHIVDFGQNNQHSPDGRVYIVGDGANETWQPQTWNMGSQTYMARTVGTPTPEIVHSAQGWEFWAGDGRWVPTVAEAAPLFTWENRTGSTTITFAPKSNKYIMTVNCQTDGGVFPSPDNSWFDMYFLEADIITGPYRLITYLKQFGPAAYFAGFTSKFNVKDFPDSGYLSYSQWGELTPHGGSNPPNR